MDAEAERYFAQVAALPRPTLEQTREFVRFVAGAHSWYKHLPAFPPGAPFYFYLDPNAGRESVMDDQGRPRYVDRVEGMQRFHYTWMFTADYQQRFGFWNYYHGGGGTFFLLQTAEGLMTTEQPTAVLADSGEWIAVPKTVREAGTCYVTSWVHEYRRLGVATTRSATSTSAAQPPSGTPGSAQSDGSGRTYPARSWLHPIPLLSMYNLLDEKDQGRQTVETGLRTPDGHRYRALAELWDEMRRRDYASNLELTPAIEAFQAAERPVQLRRMHAAALRALELFQAAA